ncbi:methyl-accepting chemotaxis protein, partial [Bradyrhizobium sp. Pear76]|nr:methyl-accepting chemotaxis protein [Bradyrhizobium oropedii]
MCDLLKADLDSAVAEVFSMSDEASLRGASAATDAQSIANQATVLAASSEQASNNVTSVSAAAEELSLTGRKIAARTADAANYASRAAGEAAKASETVAALKDAAERLVDIVSTISEVAAQTDLLALNATIEAARVGDAGKGFAVVAHEVKALAQKTSSATEDIARRVHNICTATNDSVVAIDC